MTGEGMTHATREELIALRRQLPGKLSPPLDRIHSARSGTHVSTLRGRGMDYRESRAYQPGDDVRRMDWRLTARSGRLHTKLFQEERERSLMVVVDDQPSMHFGTRRRFKSVQAARAAAMAGWLGAASGMRVGMLGYGTASGHVAPRMGSRGALAMIHALAGESRTSCDGTSSDGTSSLLSESLQRLDRMARGGTQVLVITDGSGVDASLRQRLVAMRRHARLGILLVVDALESELPAPGQYPMAWDGQMQTLDLQRASQRARFRDVLGRDARHIRDMARGLGIPLRQIDTEDEPLDAVAFLMGMTMRSKRP